MDEYDFHCPQMGTGLNTHKSTCRARMLRGICRKTCKTGSVLLTPEQVSAKPAKQTKPVKQPKQRKLPPSPIHCPICGNPMALRTMRGIPVEHCAKQSCGAEFRSRRRIAKKLEGKVGLPIFPRCGVTCAQILACKGMTITTAARQLNIHHKTLAAIYYRYDLGIFKERKDPRKDVIFPRKGITMGQVKACAGMWQFQAAEKLGICLRQFRVVINKHPSIRKLFPKWGGESRHFQVTK